MAYLDNLAKLPEKNITYLKKNKTFYVIYNYGYKRNANGNPQSKKISIGKLIDKEARIFLPNENYLKVYSNPQFIEKKPEASKMLASEIQYTKPEGLLTTIESICKDIELDETLRKVFGIDADLILSLSSYMVACGNVMKGYEKWAKKHYLPVSLCVNDKRI
ncbi:hypothetical protein CKF54_07595, partial [Psittacicella hinzii]